MEDGAPASLLLFIVLSGKILANIAVYNVEYSYSELIGAITQSFEPIAVMSFTNAVFSSGVTADTTLYILGSTLPGLDIGERYHDIVLKQVFPMASFGMGGNMVGEAWANGGYFGILLLSLYFMLNLVLLDYFISRTQGTCVQWLAWSQFSYSCILEEVK